MTGRTPACEDSAAIGARLRELQAERIAMLAGCNCPSSVRGEKLHVPSCPLRAPPQAALALAVAMERLRARARLRSCTCAPSEAPRPCPHRYALSECWSAANSSGPDGLATRGSRLRPSSREASPGEDTAEALRVPPVPSQMVLATEALWRARARLRTRDAAERYVEHIERAIAQKYARHRVLS
jgi:hypothetical protein